MVFGLVIMPSDHRKPRRRLASPGALVVYSVVVVVAVVVKVE